MKGPYSPTPPAVTWPLRTTSGYDFHSSFLATIEKYLEEHGVEVCQDVIVELLKTKMDNLKKEVTCFKPDLVSCCFSSAQGEGQLPFVFVCLALELTSHQPKRRIISNIVCNLLRIAMSSSSPEEDLVAVLRLLSYEIPQLSIGEHDIITAIAETYHLKEVGDVSLVAQTTACSTRCTLLSVSRVYHSFLKIAQISADDSNGEKISILKQLISASRECEIKYLIRLLLPKQGLRVGFSEATLIESLGRAAVFLEKDNPPFLEEGAAIVKQAYAVLPVYEKIVDKLFSIGLRKLQETCGPSVGIPVEPMLCKAVGSIDDARKMLRICEYICECKYDGERAQIHFVKDGIFEIFSRNLECITRKYPSVVDAVKRLTRDSVTSFIMDCEIVAYDHCRGHKGDVGDIEINGCIFAFDLLYLNGESLIEACLPIRRTCLIESFVEEVGRFQFAAFWSSRDLYRFRFFLAESRFEGLIFKPVCNCSKYEPGKRNWLKLTKDFIESPLDSLDLVPIGAFDVYGKRTGVCRKFLLACYDPDTEEFQIICTACLPDNLLNDCYDRFCSKVITNPKPSYNYDSDRVQPHVWFEPSEVWEVKGTALVISQVYSAATGLVDPTNGVSLLDPTVLRVCIDKVPELATTAEQVAEMYSQRWHLPCCEDGGNEVP